jgi:hypothetical protein
MNEHPASQEEVRELFLLGRLSPAATRELEEHLRQCNSCREEMQREKLLQEGLKHLGRKTLKDRLSRQLSSRRERQIRWFQLAGAAAILLCVIGVGINYEWFVTQELGELEATRLDDRHTPSIEKELADKQISTETLTSQQPTDEKDRSRVTPSLPESESKPADLPEANRTATNTRQSSREVVQGEIPDRPSTGGRKSGTAEEYWMVGVLLAEIKPEAVQEAVPETVPEAGRSMKKERVHLFGRVEESPKEQKRDVTLQQMLREELPRTELLDKVDGQSQQVRTRVQRADQKLILTLFLDSLVDEETIRQSWVEQVSEDSLVVHLGSQRIGYRVPQAVQHTITR